jgi:hypothetical protein
MKVTPTRKVTYLGVPAERAEVRLAGPMSERVVIIHWLAEAKGQPVEHPAGTTTLARVKGDGRKPDTFQVFRRQVLTDTPLAEAIKVAEAMLS